MAWSLTGEDICPDILAELGREPETTPSPVLVTTLNDVLRFHFPFTVDT